MEDLKKALLLRRHYNRMDFDEFVNELEKYIGEKIPEEEKENYEFSGLLNIDLFTMYVDL